MGGYEHWQGKSKAMQVKSYESWSNKKNKFQHEIIATEINKQVLNVLKRRKVLKRR